MMLSTDIRLEVTRAGISIVTDELVSSAQIVWCPFSSSSVLPCSCVLLVLSPPQSFRRHGSLSAFVRTWIQEIANGVAPRHSVGSDESFRFHCHRRACLKCTGCLVPLLIFLEIC